MSAQVVVALGIVIATMAIALVGIMLRRRADAAGTHQRTIPRWLIITLLSVGTLVVLITAGGLLIVLMP